jgi:hypothetical protein
MHGSRGVRRDARTAAGLGALALAAVLCFLLFAAARSDAALVGKDGRVYACYKTKGKAKGSVRLVAKKGHCRKGEKKVSWKATGTPGQQGVAGEEASSAEPGSPGEPGSAGSPGALEKQITTLTKKVAGLEEVLKGVTNPDLLGALGKLQGVSGAGLQEAVAKVPVVDSLCKQATALTSQSNALGAALGGLSLEGIVGTLKLFIPAIPAPLPSFSCP